MSGIARVQLGNGGPEVGVHLLLDPVEREDLEARAPEQLGERDVRGPHRRVRAHAF